MYMALERILALCRKEKVEQSSSFEIGIDKERVLIALILYSCYCDL